MKIVPGDALSRTVPGSAATRPDPAQTRLQASETTNNPSARQRERSDAVPRQVDPATSSEVLRRDIPRGSFLDILI